MKGKQQRLPAPTTTTFQTMYISDRAIGDITTHGRKNTNGLRSKRKTPTRGRTVERIAQEHRSRQRRVRNPRNLKGTAYTYN